MKTPRKEKTTITLELGHLGRWPLEIDAALLKRLQDQAAADGHFILADPAEARRYARHLEDTLGSMLRREFAPPTPAQVNFARRIAELLELEVPAETLESKVLISAFIATHKDDFDKAEQAASSPGLRLA